MAAEAWRGIVKAKTEELIEAEITARSEAGDTAIADAARERLGTLAEQRRALFERHSTVVNSWEKKGGDEAAITEYRAYRSSIIVEETRTSDVQTLMTRALAWLTASDGRIELSALGVDISSVFALIRGASFILAFAFQDTLGNLATWQPGKRPDDHD